ncbi:polyphenol oxidase, chloroplastic-like [Neltuma alba]|uniref:polyphenol oxidase, chloroplastic-like n=1 Tax=Neltuma alba TaxID=207710 RepID=UPI0010A5636D|nr:polyphenol oxidase, chloroplastic-like [Prosopis alba]
MASLHPSLVSARPSFRNNNPKAIKLVRIPNRASRSVACKAITDDDDFDSKNPKTHRQVLAPDLARRNLLLGLGGLYGSLHHNDPFAFANPILPPDVAECVSPELHKCAKPTNCCPPPSRYIKDFEFPATRKLKIRPAAHLVDERYREKYREAVRRMKALPPDDPRNFMQQANVHCAYCDGAYHQVGFPDLDLEVHGSWLFFPFHRWFLYFYERILSSLIDDPTFALPFWNWDAPAGMVIPEIYTDPHSTLYDPLRNADHQPPTPADFNFSSGCECQRSWDDQVDANLKTMYKQMVSGAKRPSLFFGAAYRAGQSDPNNGEGTIELIPHNTMHNWTGDNCQPNGEDMGSFYSAARDPIFYSHHANVDRMWEIWKTLPGGKRRDIRDPDWLESGFLFYDENKDLVRVKIKDCLDTGKLGYTYKDVGIPWIDAKPTRSRSTFLKSQGKKFDGGKVKFPLVLRSPVSITVEREKGRSKKEKEMTEEVLVIEGIEFSASDSPVKFDVYVHREGEFSGAGGPMTTEFAGSFVSVPHHHKRLTMKTNLRLGITELLEDLGADDDKRVGVTLVPQAGKGRITIERIKIEYIDE